MKLGFSFGRCVRDIVNGKVHVDDVFLIVSQTAIRDSSQIPGVVEEYLYRPDYLAGLSEETCNRIATHLYLSGKIHQPRLLGHTSRLIREDAVWMDLAPTINDETQATDQVLQAWKQYQLALKMTSLNQFPNVNLRDNF
jgi:hypothetical protein